MQSASSPTEDQLKARILNELRRTKRISAATTIANELPLGTTGLRADIAICSRHFTGIEVKSNRDSLKRLSRQLDIYRGYFDKTILVLDKKHWSQASRLDLSSLELWIAEGLKLKRLKKGIVSDKSENQINLLSAALQKKYSNIDPKRRNAKAFFMSAFRDRFKLTNLHFWSATANRPISTEDLTLLSRFVDKRERIADAMNKARRSHERWLDQLAQSVHSSSVSRKPTSS